VTLRRDPAKHLDDWDRTIDSLITAVRALAHVLRSAPRIRSTRG
jgi:hypothetical protein